MVKILFVFYFCGIRLRMRTPSAAFDPLWSRPCITFCVVYVGSDRVLACRHATMQWSQNSNHLLRFYFVCILHQLQKSMCIYNVFIIFHNMLMYLPHCASQFCCWMLCLMGTADVMCYIPTGFDFGVWTPCGWPKNMAVVKDRTLT